MADKKISQMTELTTISDSDMIEVVHTLSNFKLLFSTIKGWIQTWITKAMVGLGNVDNTSDLAKPISNATQSALSLKADTSALNSYLTISNASNTYVTLSQKGAANGVVPLGSDGKIASAYLPSYVDDVLEYNGTGNFPQPGESGKLYIDTSVTSNNTYRWSGSQYVHIAGSPGSTDAVPEGATNLYFTNARAVAALQATLSSYATQAWVNNNYMPRSGGTFTGPISMTAGSAIQAAGGDWGAYINLAKAPNGSLTNPTILQYQDKILFFENGGGGRGAYLDWGNLSSWGNNRILTTSDLNGYATQGYVQSYVNGLSFATQSYVDNKVASAGGGAFAKLSGVLSNGSFIKIDLGANGAAIVGIMAANGSTVCSCSMGGITNTSSSYAGPSSTSNISVNNTRQVPNGSTGSSGALTLFFDPSGRYIYLENRKGISLNYAIPFLQV